MASHRCIQKNLVTHLRQDARSLHSILANAGEIPPAKDFKLQALIGLLKSDFPGEKFLLFTQFADTAAYSE